MRKSPDRDIDLATRARALGAICDVTRMYQYMYSLYLYVSVSDTVYLYVSVSDTVYLYVSVSDTVYLYVSVSDTVYLYVSCQ